MLAPLLIWTVMIQGPFAACVYRCSLLLKSAFAPAHAFSLALLSIAVLPIVLRLIFPDKLRARPLATCFATTYLTHWTACGIASLLSSIALVFYFPLHYFSVVPYFNPSSIAAFVYLLSLSFCIYGALIRKNWPLTRHLNLPIKNLPPRFNRFRIVHITDLHIGSFTQKSLVKRWISLINKAAPDLILVTGDLVSSGNDYLDEIQSFLSSLHAPYGVIVSPGNHDYFGHSQQLFDKIKTSGAILLRNQSITISRDSDQIAIVGLDDPCSRRANLPLALKNLPPNLPIIALAHDPEIFPECAKHEIALTLSGHTHGGQIALPFFARWISIKSFSVSFSLGVYSINSSFLCVGGGLGTSGPPVRIGVPPEITVICLHP